LLGIPRYIDVIIRSYKAFTGRGAILTDSDDTFDRVASFGVATNADSDNLVYGSSGAESCCQHARPRSIPICDGLPSSSERNHGRPINCRQFGFVLPNSKAIQGVIACSGEIEFVSAARLDEDDVIAVFAGNLAGEQFLRIAHRGA
jgi:hypothetical protein